MPSSRQHTNQAVHNLKFLESFYNSYEFNDWAITVGFYASVHIIENAIALKKTISYRGEHISIQHSGQLPRTLEKEFPHLLPENYSHSTFTHHVARNSIVKENFPEIADVFELLYKNSRIARYFYHSWDKIQVETIVKPALTKIINWSNKEFKTKFILNL